MSYDLLESQYALRALAARAAVLEKIINRLIGKNWFIWESHLSPQFFSIPKTFKALSNPSVGLTAHWAIFVVAGLFTPLMVMYLKFWENRLYLSSEGTFKLAVILLFLYALGTGLVLVWCNFKILGRMSQEALKLASQTAKDHGAVF